MGNSEKQSQMRLLLLTDGLAPFVTGGMQQHSTLLAKYMAPLLKHLTVMHCGPINGEVPGSEEVLAELDHPSNVYLIGVPFMDHGKLPGHYLRASKKLSQRYLKEAGDLSSYDAIYAQGLTGDAFLGKHPKVMVNLHGLNMFQQGFTLRERLAKSWLRPLFRKQVINAWRAVSLGGRLTDLLIDIGVSEDRIAVIPNGIESKWILSKEELRKKAERRKGKALRFVMVGRNEFTKGLHILQAAMVELNDPIELHMIGDWPEWDSGIHNVVHHGVIRDKNTLMSTLDECDVLLLPSLSEGMPTVILEAAARGLPAIATNVGAVAEVVPQKNVIEPGNMKVLRYQMSESMNATSNREVIRPDTWDEIANQTYESLTYKSVMN